MNIGVNDGPDWDRPTEAEALPPRDYAVPSLYAPRGRLRDNPDLVELCQLQAIVILALLEDCEAATYSIASERVNRLRMTRPEITVDEAERIFVRVES